jgi:hypothetical protein
VRDRTSVLAIPVLREAAAVQSRPFKGQRTEESLMTFVKENSA